MKDFEVWFEDMRRRAWAGVREGYEGEPMYEQYLVLLKPFFLEAFDTICESRQLVYAENERLRARLDEATELMRKLGK